MAGCRRGRVIAHPAPASLRSSQVKLTMPLDALLGRARIRPAFVQNRCLARASWDPEVRALCHTHDIIYQALSLISGNRQVLLKPTVTEIAHRHNKMIPQVVLVSPSSSGCCRSLAQPTALTCGKTLTSLILL
jgi:hypothetical protein